MATRIHTLTAAIAASLALSGTAIAEGRGGLTGLRGMDHIGFAVPDPAQAVSFSGEVRSSAEGHPPGPFSGSEPTWMGDHPNMDATATIPEMRPMRCGNCTNLEIFTCTAPDQRRVQPRNSDIGGHQLAFYVDDMEAAVVCLQSRDVEGIGAPAKTTEGPGAGETWAYFMALWGKQLKLVSYPDGTARETGFENRLWDPRS